VLAQLPCPRCSYELSGLLAGRCPECGRPFISTRDFDPVRLIRAVNTLHALGRDGALRAIEAYLKLCDDRECSWELRLQPERVFPILQLLFVRADGVEQLPPLYLGLNVHPVEDSTSWPLFPIALSADVPFCVAGEGIAQGVPHPPEERVSFCREECRLRTRPLEPTLDPCAAADRLVEGGTLEELESSSPWRTTAHLGLPLYRQAMDAAGAVVRVDPVFKDELKGRPDADIDRRWREYATGVAARRAVWSVELQDFVAQAALGALLEE
jgi:hypothetical protein